MPDTKQPRSTPGYIKEKLLSMVTNTPSLTLNYIAHVTGITAVERHSNLSLEQYHSPKARAKILRDYEKGIKVKGLADPVDKLLEGISAQLTKIRSTTGLEDFKKQIEENDTLSAEEKKSKISICEQIEKNLIRPNSAELQVFEDRLRVLFKLLKNDKIDNPRAIVEYIEGQYKKMLEQIELDKKSALTNVKSLFEKIPKTPESKKELEAMQQAMEKRISDSYDDKVDEKDKAKNKLVTLYEGTPEIPAATESDKAVPAVPGLKERLAKATEQAEQELINLVLYAEHTDSKALPASTKMEMGAGASPNTTDPRKYREIDFDDYVKAEFERTTGVFSWEAQSPKAWADYVKFLCNTNHELRTPSGLLLRHSEAEISITIPAHYTPYHQYNDNQLLSDLLCMINEQKAKGKKVITISINIHDPDLRQKIMEETYIAGKLAGYPDEMLKFNVTNHNDDKQTIKNQTAKEIKNQLGQAQGRLRLIQYHWNEQEKAAKDPSKLSADVAAIDRQINAELHTAPISATTHGIDGASTSSPFSVGRMRR